MRVNLTDRKWNLVTKACDELADVLFYLEELAVKQIARLMGAKENAIQVRLHRARQRLRDLLKESDK